MFWLTSSFFYQLTKNDRTRTRTRTIRPNSNSKTELEPELELSRPNSDSNSNSNSNSNPSRTRRTRTFEFGACLVTKNCSSWGVRLCSSDIRRKDCSQQYRCVLLCNISPFNNAHDNDTDSMVVLDFDSIRATLLA